MRLYRARDEDAAVAGVLAGLGEYFNVDPTILRIVFVLLVFMNVFPLIPLYILGAVIIPKAPKNKEVKGHPNRKNEKVRKRPKSAGWMTQGRPKSEDAPEVEEVEEDDWSDF